MKPVFHLQVPGRNANFDEDMNKRLRKQGDKILDVVERVTSELDGISKDGANKKNVEYFVPGSPGDDNAVVFRFNGPPVFVLQRASPLKAWKRSEAADGDTNNTGMVCNCSSRLSFIFLLQVLKVLWLLGQTKDDAWTLFRTQRSFYTRLMKIRIPFAMPQMRKSL